MKKYLSLALALVMATAVTACGNTDAQTPEANNDNASANLPLIGISQYGQHASLDNCREGFLLGLEESGLVEGEDFVVDYQNAAFDDTIAMQIGQSFSANNVDLMCAIATPAATSCFAAAEDKDIPVVFTAITDPAAAKLVDGNITGTSDKLPVEAQLELIRALQPEAKTIGILYTTSEPNSVSAIAEYEEKAPFFDFEIVAIGVLQQAEVMQAADNIIAKGVDCITNLTDNNVVGVLPSILEKTNDAGIPVYGSEIEQVRIGCVASAGIDYVKLGKQTGEMAALILSGEKTAEELPYETIAEYETYINTAALADMGLSIVEDDFANAIDVAE